MSPIKFLDILVILLIVFNIGALVTTHILVVKKEPQSKFGEANLAAAEAFDLQPLEKKQANKIYNMIIFKGLLYGFIVGTYYFLRTNYLITKSNYNFYTMILFVFLIGFVYMYDFFNNFGYLLGVILYGVE